MHLSRTLLVPLGVGVLLTGVLSVDGPAGARPTPIGQDSIVAGQPYTGDFPDPWILRTGKRYHAYSTTSDGINIPVLTATSVRHWVARAATPDSPDGDGLPKTPAWAGSKGPWAPSVTRLGKHRFVMAYAVEDGNGTGRMCISLAYAARAGGPFVDRSTGPAVCRKRGAIDPQVFIAPTGRPWLVWKKDHFPAKLVTQPMNRNGTRVRPGVKPRFLAKVSQPWEGSIIENPAMIRFKKRYYLFYSANSYATTRYAIGYLICKSWKGECHKPRKKPLIASVGAIAGPGGPAPFVNTRGKLRLGYHAWRAGQVGYSSSIDCQLTGSCGQRRLYVANLKVKPGGRLKVTRSY